MSRNFAKHSFLELCDEALRVEKATLDLKVLEPVFEKIVTVVQENPESRDDFVQYFTDMVNGDMVIPHELIQFCMHVLRWEEVSEATKTKRTITSDLRQLSILDKIIESFDDDWEDRDFYRRFTESN